MNDIKNVMNEETFDYFNSDVNFLAINILLEGFYRSQNIFTLDQFLKGNYWKIEEIADEIRDTNDFSNVKDMVLHQVIGIIESFNLAKITRISVKDISGLLELVVSKAVKTENPIDDDIGYFTAVINEIYDLKKLSDAKIEAEMAKQDKVDFKSMLSRVNFKDADEAARHLSFISSIAAPHIELEISFIDEVAKETDKAVEDYLFSFSQDDFIDKKPSYKQKRYYFSKQLENFYSYIKEFPTIDGSINIPFSSLEKQDFEVVKVLSYLERGKIVKIRNWNDVDMWNVKFHTTPITLQSLVAGNAETKSEDDFKENLSFNEAKSVLLIGDKPVKIRKFSDQYHILRIIFEQPERIKDEWFFSEIAEKYDDVGTVNEDKKFYNATYQIAQKIIKDTGIRDFFITTKQSARINPKYLN